MTKQKKIAIVCNYALNPNRIGGMDRFYVAYDRKAKTLGYEIDWYFLNYEFFDFYSELTIFSANNQNMESFFLEKVNQENLQYDTLVTHFLSLCTSFFKKAKARGIQQTIVVDHNPRPLEGFPFSKILKNKIKGILYSQYIDQFIGVSEYTRKHILKDYGSFLDKKTSVIYNGIDTMVFVKRVNENTNKFVVCSHLRPSKGIQDLIKAVAVLEENIKSQIQIDVYGEGPYENELLEMIKENNLERIIHFRGGSSQLNELLYNYRYLVQPTYMECFSLSILESLAANVPVITTTVGGNLEIIENNTNGFIFEPKDYLALSEILKNIVLENLKIDNDVSLQIEKDFNLEKMVNEHIQLLN
ncbi:glycosyltransferase family 4 protein [Flavobacterium franklandianum]|uniref:Glycosyltransferase family 4 protein n=1 Tax=Flavobacterium franklandianum TaxID=2594430 RepID=A0A553CKB6_9FLAO|nr:glycosyltransferase family 4 protein [Flavobacterium franklandianum]TRX20931.1 glycosyltransferase family 4 protein [Flavobacterium franklandianum]TRX24095.1 glycosyltransferase family 4 protein [Flavobacterium franklandianum]